MTSSSWPARRMTLKNQTPSIVPTKPPPRRKAESLRSMRVAPPGGERARHRRGGDLRLLGADRDRRRDAEEDQERRHQEAAADPEQPRDEADRRPHRQDEQHVDGDLGDREIELHRRIFFGRSGSPQVSRLTMNPSLPPTAPAGSPVQPAGVAWANQDVGNALCRRAARGREGERRRRREAVTRASLPLAGRADFVEARAGRGVDGVERAGGNGALYSAPVAER